MNELYNIISTLNKEEKRNLKIFLNRTNSSENRKDIALFDFVKKNNPINESKIFNQLYPKKDKNSFYRLKNRLLNDIHKSLLLLHFNKTSYNTTINFISISKLFQKKRRFDIAYNYLQKAEKIAFRNEFFNLLEQIYNEFIKLSHESTEFNPSQYIEKRKENRKNLSLLQEIDDVLAVLIYQIKTSQNFLKHNLQFNKELQKIISKYAKSDEVKKSTKLRFKTYHAVSRILLQKNDFKSLEEYLLYTYYEFLNEGLFNRSNHETKLQMLTYLVNSLFKNNKIKESLNKTEELKQAMKEYDNLLYNKYLFYYYNSLVINYQVTDKTKAIDVLLEAKTKKAIQQSSMFIVFIYLNLAVFYFDLKNFKAAKTNIVLLKREKDFDSLDEAFQLKISIAELQIIKEVEDFELFEYLLKNIKRVFNKLLKKEEYERENMFLGVSQKMDKKGFQIAYNNFLNMYPTEELGSNDIINYNVWLKNKFNKKE